MRHQEPHTYQDHPEYDDHPEAVRSEPVPVPTPPGAEADRPGDDGDRTDDELLTGDQPRAEDGSGPDGAARSDGQPPADADLRAEDEVRADDAPADDAARAEDVRADDEVRAEELREDDDFRAEVAALNEPGPHGGDADGSPADDQDRPEYHDPAPVPTAFGAPTVGGAVAASALASEDRTAEPDPRDERTADPANGVVDADPTGNRPTDVRPVDAEPVAGGPVDGGPVDAEPVATGPVDTLPVGTDPVDGQPVGTESVAVGSDGATEERVLAAGNPALTGDQPAVAADESTTPSADESTTTADGELLPGAVPAAPVATLLAADAAQGFRDRWREVQLRFVDDPRAAAGEAQGLAEEAIEALAAALAAQKDELGGWQDGSADDTEQLRVVVRRYRDFLDKILDL
ncbi:hypothetical protein O7627_06070 [Solwaraspora sp. WMMD1047]|uniref:hypothetical protein n=1 Tax=Solwaraspora sp. WMMD1047 TaxID=3016102 RepID=UPI0024173818|nr:hypothetical protein [Solwaraspora sp. WMMD1047]MDG4828871.1 hypothetical protein [Solwaraspora sp. WMMD1047]